MACCKSQGCEKRKEAMLDAGVLTAAAGQGAAIINKLLEIASIGGGLMGVFKDNPKLVELVAAINSLAAENQYLKKMLGAAGVAPSITTHSADLTINFGPQNEYTITLPTSNQAERDKLAQQLVKAAAHLMDKKARADLPGQKSFSFVEK